MYLIWYNIIQFHSSAGELSYVTNEISYTEISISILMLDWQKPLLLSSLMNSYQQKMNAQTNIL